MPNGKHPQEMAIVIFHDGKFYNLNEDDWRKDKFIQKEAKTAPLVPHIVGGTFVAHMDEPISKTGTWSTLLNLESILKSHGEGKKWEKELLSNNKKPNK